MAEQQLTPRLQKALRECFEYTNDGRKYVWMQQSMKQLVAMGLARTAGKHGGELVHVLTTEGISMLGERETPSACPFCGSKDVQIHHLDDKNDYLQCHKCWCTGPTGSDEKAAMRLWNARVSK